MNALRSSVRCGGLAAPADLGEARNGPTDTQWPVASRAAVVERDLRRQATDPCGNGKRNVIRSCTG